MKSHRVPVSLIVFSLGSGLLAGCASTPDTAPPPDTVSGYYAGHWYGPNPEQPLGELMCTITPKDANSWNAHFVATFGETGEYQVPLEGNRLDGKVVFDGEVDLGGDQGGVFEWSGEIVGDTFNGEYSAARYTGTFRMTKTTPPE